ncbi:MAG: hypothetical protein PHZ09_00235 [Eubacteriales bacterium]|nr:hypothetical protein [Eubacteriales bacterium]
MKIHALILAMVLLFCAAGCAAQADNEAPLTDTPDVTQQETDYMDTLPDENYDGYVFTVLAQSYDERPNLPAEAENGEVLNDALVRRNIKTEEIYNIGIENIALEDRGQVKSMVQTAVNANDDIYGLVITSMADGINSLAPNGFLYDLNKINYLQLESEWWCAYISEDMQFSGSLYFTSGALSPFFYYTPVGVAYNIKLAADYNIGNLNETVRSGQWTFDKLKELTANLTTDIDGDGKLTEADFYALSHDGGVAGQAMLISCGEKMSEIDAAGNHFLNLGSERIVTLVDQIATLLGDKDICYVDKAGSSLTLFSESRLMFLMISMNNIIAGYQGVPGLRVMEDDYGIIPTPKLNEAQDNYYTYGNPWGPSGIAVPVTAADADRTGLITETMAYLSFTDVKPAVYDIIVKEKIARDPESVEMLDIMYAAARFDLNGIFDFGGSAMLLRECACGVKDDFVSKYAAIKDKAEAALKTLVELQESVG